MLNTHYRTSVIRNSKAVTPKQSAGSIVRAWTAQNGPMILEMAPIASIQPIYDPAECFPINFENRLSVTPQPKGNATLMIANPITNLAGSMILGL